MGRARRAFGVTVALSVAGAIVGAICGCLALLPLIVSELSNRSVPSALAAVSGLAGFAAGVGAVVGAVCGPTLAWSLLRNVSLGRVIKWSALGTVVGAFTGWLVPMAWTTGPLPVFIGALLGMLVAGVALRLRAARTNPVASRPEAPNK